MNNINVYKENGYESRTDYLECLADDNNISFILVDTLAELLGEGEDFDGLVNAIEDYNEI